MTAEELLREADLAMYETKRLASSSPRDVGLAELHRADRPVRLENDLRGAAGRGELFLDYQPIVSSTDGRIVGVEALLRWNHPTRGVIPPSVLIPVADQSGLIAEIGEWVLQESQAERRNWRGPQTEKLGMAVNVSARQLMSAGFADVVRDAVASASTDPGLLTLEVTESIFVHDPGRALAVFKQLKEIGVTIALDDFGTGYSSLSFLQRYPVDCLKVDRGFVADLGRDPVSWTIVASVLDLAHGLGMDVVAEGVETDDQRRELAELDCDHCQGFYFARPMPPGSLAALLQDDGSDVFLPASPSAALS